jgi:hypothetical protein
VPGWVEEQTGTGEVPAYNVPAGHSSRVRLGRLRCILGESRSPRRVSTGKVWLMLWLIIIIVLVVLLLGGFGFSRRGR